MIPTLSSSQQQQSIPCVSCTHVDAWRSVHQLSAGRRERHPQFSDLATGHGHNGSSNGSDAQPDVDDSSVATVLPTAHSCHFAPLVQLEQFEVNAAAAIRSVAGQS